MKCPIIKSCLRIKLNGPPLSIFNPVPILKLWLESGHQYAKTITNKKLVIERIRNRDKKIYTSKSFDWNAYLSAIFCNCGDFAKIFAQNCNKKNQELLRKIGWKNPATSDGQNKKLVIERIRNRDKKTYTSKFFIEMLIYWQFSAIVAISPKYLHKIAVKKIKNFWGKYDEKIQELFA